MGSWRPNPGAMNLEDPMATVIKKPGTPLPFVVKQGCVFPPRKEDPIEIAKYWPMPGAYAVLFSVPAGFMDSQKDAEYLVHAGNVYPGLVEMLHDLAALDDGLHVRTVRAHALAKLRELGEVQS